MKSPLLSRGGEAALKAQTDGAGLIPTYFLTNTTPALRATPPLLRRGLYSLVREFIHTFYDRAYIEEKSRYTPFP